MLKCPLPISTRRNGFTLIELLVVMGIVILLVAVSAPVLKTLSKSNSTASAANLVRAYLANARAIAISQHRQAGIVFFEETGAAGTLAHANQTAMQLVWEDADQTQYAPKPGNTVFVQYSNDRQYLPAGLQVATLNDDPTKQILTAQNTTGSACRFILFDPEGQMVLRSGITRPNVGSSKPGQYPWMYGDWIRDASGAAKGSPGTASNFASSPAILIYNKAEYDTETFATDAQRSAWLQSNAQIIVINAYTGGVIR
ncbi:MAG TPA: prepilin-type N-terminal cleavage/methylation domain-containing protein [Phycisphaerae bacterium]|nr:prepilin-type N-terminal cleavage/methylation domain-containing protein [Phycisphaerae bacterium]